MVLKIIYFAAVRDLVGVDEESLLVDAEKIDVVGLVKDLQRKHPQLLMEGVRIAVNEEFANEQQTLADGDVVALIPPVSGG